ncbi:aminoacyl-tRNA hydrolase, partial [Micrococcus sp. HSID17227]
LREALAPPTPRRATTPTRGPRRRRLEAKRRRSEVKRTRRRPGLD